MGVMKCSRSYCGEVMCTKYINDVGYLCGSCLNEFQELLEKEGALEFTPTQFTEKLQAFKETRPGSTTEKPVTFNTFLAGNRGNNF